jgi:hypothetical protein
MDPAIARTPAPSFVFEDGLGTRHHSSDAGNQPLEILTLREALTAVPSFEFALRERASRLAGFRQASYAHVRGIDKAGSTLAVVSDRVDGVRLSELLTVAEQQLLPVEIDAALCVIRQLVQAVAMLHEQVPDVCHGALSLERVIITPNGRAVIVEHVLGAALGQLLFSRENYLNDLRIAMPPRAGSPRFDRRADVTQLGAISLALILGRPLGDDDYPGRIAEIVERVGAVSATGGLEPLPAGLRSWLARALQLDPRNSFSSAIEARTELDAALRETDYAAAPSTLENFLAQYDACVGIDSQPAAAPVTPIVPAAHAPVAAASKAPAIVAAKPPAPSMAPPVAIASTSVGTAEASVSFGMPKADAFAPHAVMPAAPKLSGPATAPLRSPADETHHERPTKQPPSRRPLIAAAVVLIAVTSGGALAARHYLMPGSGPVDTGTLIVKTDPSGMPVVVDGKARGTTPLEASLTPGDHLVELVVSETERRKIPVTITAGGQVSQFIELPKAAPVLGRLQVRSEPSGARVTVDGHVFGRAPVTIESLTPGEHLVTLENELGSVKESVTIEAGATATLVVPMSTPQGAPVSGWIAVTAPADVQIFENGRLLGSSKSERIMVSVGRHELEMVNESLGYRNTQSVQVAPGQTASVRPEWPKGSLALNALPWADVFIDGKLVGETPIGSIAVPIGAHEIVFRHPDFGEHRVSTIVTVGTPARLSVDLRKK